MIIRSVIGCILLVCNAASGENALSYDGDDGRRDKTRISAFLDTTLTGNYADFLGSRLLRISYPNINDAEAGYRKQLISKKEMECIVSANKKMEIPPKDTRLGGGIVIHGWKGDWVADGNQNLTWGCISMHNGDLEEFYDIVKLQTKIIIAPR